MAMIKEIIKIYASRMLPIMVPIILMILLNNAEPAGEPIDDPKPWPPLNNE